MSQKKDWPIAHIEMYNDGRTHLSFETDTTQTSDHPYVIKTTEIIKDLVANGLGDKLQPGRVFRIKIKRLKPNFFRSTANIEFDFDRVR